MNPFRESSMAPSSNQLVNLCDYWPSVNLPPCESSCEICESIWFSSASWANFSNHPRLSLSPKQKIKQTIIWLDIEESDWIHFTRGISLTKWRADHFTPCFVFSKSTKQLSAREWLLTCEAKGETHSRAKEPLWIIEKEREEARNRSGETIRHWIIPVIFWNSWERSGRLRRNAGSVGWGSGPYSNFRSDKQALLHTGIKHFLKLSRNAIFGLPEPSFWVLFKLTLCRNFHSGCCVKKVNNFRCNSDFRCAGPTSQIWQAAKRSWAVGAKKRWELEEERNDEVILQL
jgi:hypothetical protein